MPRQDIDDTTPRFLAFGYLLARKRHTCTFNTGQRTRRNRSHPALLFHLRRRQVQPVHRLSRRSSLVGSATGATDNVVHVTRLASATGWERPVDRLLRMSVKEPSMTKRATELIGKSVVSASTGENLGTVSDLLLDEAGREVVGMVLRHGLMKSEDVLPAAAVQTIGPDAIVSRSHELIGAKEWNDRQRMGSDQPADGSSRPRS